MNKTKNFHWQRISLILWPCCHSIAKGCHKGATDKSLNDLFLFLFMILLITSQSQLCPNGHQIIMNKIFLPVSYCLHMETLSNFNWVTIRLGCGVSEHTTKEKN